MRLLGLLKRIEWVETPEAITDWSCPACGGSKPRHDQTCELEAMIDRLREIQAETSGEWRDVRSL